MAKKHQKDGKIKKLERKSKAKQDRPNSELDCNQSESSQHEIYPSTDYPHQYHPHYDIERQQQYPQDREHYQPRHHNPYYQHSQQLQQQHQHPRYPQRHQRLYQYFRKNTDLSKSTASGDDSKFTYAWCQLWLCVILILLFPFTIFGLITLVLMLTAYTDLNNKQFRQYQRKIKRTKYILATVYFTISLLFSLGLTMIIILSSTNMLNKAEILNKTRGYLKKLIQ
ncbi:unnamed protein product [Trichobilharzia regenti]|uniref:Uncharacterized protein n=1 Tax=Trichobilharzia regenti TaxID=157069 RepID=A0A183VPE7_TRIRE|nr:unnamed protein product [Trichobilharzia regenti]VDP98232.1 unnamed protein product [Trichobilharzia regenti]